MRISMKMQAFWCLILAVGVGAVAIGQSSAGRPETISDDAKSVVRADLDRSPIAIALSKDGARLLTANQTSNSVSLVDLHEGTLLDEVQTGEKPSGIAISSDGKLGIVAHWYGYDVVFLAIQGDSLEITGRLAVGPEPRGVAISSDDKTAYVAVGASNEVVRIDVPSKSITGRLAVGREPRGLAITPDGKRLVVGNARSKELSVVDLDAWKVVRTSYMEGDNLRQVAVSPDGKYAYVANMKNRGFATTKNHIDLGWVLGQRLTRISLDGGEGFETLSLDPRGKAVGDVHGVALSPDGRIAAVSAAGTHELLIIRFDKGEILWRTNSSRDIIPPDLLKGSERFRRVALGGRPTELAFSPDSKTIYAANYLLNVIQAVDAESGEVVRTIGLGGPSEPSLARRGEAPFHDATRSFNQWYSCNTCHSDGHTNGNDFDTLNDGYQDLSTSHLKSRKKVPSLRRVTHTGPWTWHGWQKSLDEAMVESFTKSMQGPSPRGEEVDALVAFLGTLDYPTNPNRAPDGSLSEQAKRGEAIFRSKNAGCSSCHSGPEFTDGKVHVVGLEENYDRYKGYNPPSLRGVYDKDPYLHDGRAKALKDVFKEAHGPDVVLGQEPLSDGDVEDLVAYLKSL